MPKKTDQLTELLEQFKKSDVSAPAMAQLLRGLLKLQPDVLNLSPEEPQKSRRKNASNDPDSSNVETSTPMV